MFCLCASSTTSLLFITIPEQKRDKTYGSLSGTSQNSYAPKAFKSRKRESKYTISYPGNKHHIIASNYTDYNHMRRSQWVFYYFSQQSPHARLDFSILSRYSKDTENQCIQQQSIYCHTWISRQHELLWKHYNFWMQAVVADQCTVHLRIHGCFGCIACFICYPLHMDAHRMLAAKGFEKFVAIEPS